MVSLPVVYYDLIAWVLFPINWLITAAIYMQTGMTEWGTKSRSQRRASTPSTGSDNDEEFERTRDTAGYTRTRGETGRDIGSGQQQMHGKKHRKHKGAGAMQDTSSTTRRRTGIDTDTTGRSEQSGRQEATRETQSYSPAQRTGIEDTTGGSRQRTTSEMGADTNQQQPQQVSYAQQSQFPSGQSSQQPSSYLQQQQPGLQQQQSGLQQYAQQQQQTGQQQFNQQQPGQQPSGEVSGTEYLRRWSGTTRTDTEQGERVGLSRASGAAHEEDIDISGGTEFSQLTDEVW